MNRNNTISEYEGVVMALLKERLIQDGAKEHNLIDHCKLNNDIHFIFDLVEIDDNKNILRLFEIKSIQSIRYNRNYTYRLLNRFKDITQAPIFLVFLDENNVLQIIPHEELLDYLNGINPGNRFPSVTTFESYYKRIAKTCIDNPDLKYFSEGMQITTISPYQASIEIRTSNMKGSCFMKLSVRIHANSQKT